MPRRGLNLLLPAILFAVVALAAPATLQAQAVYVAKQFASVVVGGEYSGYSPNFGPNRMIGFGAYGDVDMIFGLSMEAEARFLRFNSFQGEHQDTYIGGPRYVPFRHGPVRPYAKLLLGDGEMTYPGNIGYGSYFVMAPGVGVDFLFSRKWRVRMDYEYQYWPSAPNTTSSNNLGLHPNGVSIGIGYRLF